MAKKRRTSEEKEMLQWYGFDKNFAPHEYDLEDETGYMEDVWAELIEHAAEKQSKLNN